MIWESFEINPRTTDRGDAFATAERVRRGIDDARERDDASERDAAIDARGGARARGGGGARGGGDDDDR